MRTLKPLGLIIVVLLLAAPAWATNTFTAGTNQNWSVAANWTDGVGDHHVPIDGEDVDLANIAVTWDAAAGTRIPATSGTLHSLIASSGGYLIINTATIGDCSLYATTVTAGSVGTNGFLQVAGSTNKFTLVGDISGGASIGVKATHTGACQVNGNITGGTSGTTPYGWQLAGTSQALTVNGIVSGSNFATGYGVYTSNAGTVTVNNVGNTAVQGGSAANAAGIKTGSAANITVNGNIIGGSVSGTAYGVNISTGGNLTVAGNITGGSGTASGVNLSVANTTSLTGNVTAGSYSAGVTAYLSSGSPTITCTGNLVNSATSTAWSGYPPTLTVGSQYYNQWPTNAGIRNYYATSYGIMP